MKREEHLKVWVSQLDAEQMRGVLVELADFAIDAEMVCLDDDFVPYWDHSGEPLVERVITEVDNKD